MKSVYFSAALAKALVNRETNAKWFVLRNHRVLCSLNGAFEEDLSIEWEQKAFANLCLFRKLA